MILRRQKSARTGMSLLLALFIAPGYALGNLSGSGSEADSKTVAPAPKRQLAARLAVRGNQPALVNGNGSYTGATILSGSTIQTPGGVRATVQLGRLGSLDLSPNTIAVVSFNNDSVTGTLRKGCATLTANKDVNGVLITPEGESLSTEKTGSSSMSVCSGASATPVVAAGGGSSSKAPKVGKFGLDSNSTLAMLGASSFAAGGVFGRNGGSSYYGNSDSYGYGNSDRYGYKKDDRKKDDHRKKDQYNGNNDHYYGKKDHWKKDDGKKDHGKRDPWKKDHGKADGNNGASSVVVQGNIDQTYTGGGGGGINVNIAGSNNNNNSNGNTNNNNFNINVCVISNSISPSSPLTCSITP